MSGVAILQALWAGYQPLIDAVTPQGVFAGIVPRGKVPAIQLRHISGVIRHNLAAAQTGPATDRVQAMIVAGNYVQQKQLLDLVRAAPRRAACSARLPASARW